MFSKSNLWTYMIAFIQLNRGWILTSHGKPSTFLIDAIFSLCSFLLTSTVTYRLLLPNTCFGGLSVTVFTSSIRAYRLTHFLASSVNSTMKYHAKVSSQNILSSAIDANLYFFLTLSLISFFLLPVCGWTMLVSTSISPITSLEDASPRLFPCSCCFPCSAITFVSLFIIFSVCQSTLYSACCPLVWVILSICTPEYILQLVLYRLITL